MLSLVNITDSIGRAFAWRSANTVLDGQWWELLATDPIFASRWHRVKAHPNGCWFLQMAPSNPAGHVLIGTRGSRIYAHRHAYALAHGPIPDGRIVRHACDDPACIYPGHLLVGTPFDNVGDAIDRDRRNAWGRQRLTLSMVRDIRARYAAGEIQRDLARAYGVSKGCIHAVVHGLTWRRDLHATTVTATTPRTVGEA